MKKNFQHFIVARKRVTVQCLYLPWESATENELREFMPDIVLGADVIYDPKVPTTPCSSPRGSLKVGRCKPTSFG
ncbi:hypothetical protein HAX54_012648 [Datura stramonium]|uniref:Uncharacterized protein n=1 Tax=Datura stramonium TaxID=4076 RepID=A0ABS8TLV9_DATST|nr:hypothetical protein [Datura stramonium]